MALGNAEGDQLVRAKAGSEVNKNPQLMLMGDDGPCIYFDGNWLVQSVASFLIRFNRPPMA